MGKLDLLALRLDDTLEEPGMTNLARSGNHIRKAAFRVASPWVWVASALTLLASTGLTGCGNNGYSYPVPGAHFTGSVIGGQKPVGGSTIQLYAVGNFGDGSPSTALIGATLTTSDGTGTNSSIPNDSNANPGNLNNTLPVGSFTIPSHSFTCPAPSTEVYMVSTGGDPGLGTGVNPNLALMTALGQCGNLLPTTYVVMNELTTVSSVAALGGGFASTYSEIAYDDGSSGGINDQAQLVGQLNAVPEYTNTATGTVPGSALPAGYSASSTAIQTLGDIVAACVNSAGGTASNTSTPCGSLFHLAIKSAIAPTNTIDAVINILNQPTVNVSQIYLLLPGSDNPFVPTLTSAPANWLLPITSSTATQLVFTVAPTNTAANSTITPSVAVSIEDAGNNVQTSATNTVTLAIGVNPGGGTLSGETTVTAIAINGVATFTGLTINKPGTGYTLTAAASGLTTATSGTFNITP